MQLGLWTEVADPSGQVPCRGHVPADAPLQALEQQEQMRYGCLVSSGSWHLRVSSWAPVN